MLAGICMTLFACSDEPEKEIVCWGDSLTAPHGGPGLKGKAKRLIKGSAYPEYLQEMLGDEYQIINAGVGGENTLTIMARQGAFPMKLAHDITLFNSEENKFKTFIGNNDITCFLSTYNEEKVTPLLQQGWYSDSPAQINPCSIEGNIFDLSSEAKFWREEGKYQFEYNYFIESREKTPKTYTLKAGSIVRTYAMNHLKNKHANIFFIGQNGGFHDTADLIRQLTAMIDYSRSSRYIVISFHKPNRTIPTISRMKEMEDSLKHAFGTHYINLRDSLVTKGIEHSGVTPTQEDIDSIQKGQVPPQLLTDGTHFTTAGYKEIARLVFMKIKELGY